MATVLLVIHLLIAMTMIGFILLQKTEGGASGAGFSPSASVESMMRPRARPNPVGRATAVLGLCFFVTSLGLALIAKPAPQERSIMSAPVSGPAVPKVEEPVAPPSATETPATPTVPTK